MKNLFKSLMLVAVAAMAFTACQKDNNDVNNTGFAMEFNADMNDTRSYFGTNEGAGHPSFWTGGEKIDLTVGDLAPNNDLTMQVVEGSNGAQGRFSAVFSSQPTAENGVISAYIPKDSWESTWVDGGYKMMPKIPVNQTPKAASVDPAAHILQAETTFSGVAPTNSNLCFEHAVAYGKMTLKLGDLTLANIANVRVNLNGEQTYTLLPTELTEPVFWFACNEVDVTTMEVTITDKEDKTYVKEITTSVEKPLSFVTGQVSTFSVGGFEEMVVSPFESLSGTYDSWYGRYLLYVSLVGKEYPMQARIYTAPDENGLLPQGTFKATDAYDYYTNISVTVTHLEIGYSLNIKATYKSTSEAIDVTYTGIVDGICNPPTPDAVTVETDAETVTGNGNRYFTLDVSTANYTFTGLWFDAGVDGQIIAAGEFAVEEGKVAYLDAEGNDTGWAFNVTGSVTVAQDLVNKAYSLTFNLEDNNGSTFTVTYEGEIEGVYSPGAATPLEAPYDGLKYELSNFTNAAVSWNAVTGAGSYELYYTDWNVTSEPVVTNNTTYTFEGLTPGTYYTIYVKALPATEANTESDYASLYNVVVFTDHATMDTQYTFSNVVNMGSNKMQFSDANGNKAVIAFSSSLTDGIPAGLYSETGSDAYYVNGWECSFNGNYMYPFNYVEVKGNPGENQTITIVAATSYGGEVVKSVYAGVINMEVATLEYTSVTVTRDGSNLSYNFSGDGFGLYFNYYANGADGIAAGTYTFTSNVHYSYYYTYTYDGKYMTSIDLVVTGNIGETQTYEFTLHTESAGDIKTKYTGVLQVQ